LRKGFVKIYNALFSNDFTWMPVIFFSFPDYD